MFRWFKKYFIPHEGNDHQPQLLRLETAVTILSVVLFLEAIFLVQALFVSTGTSYFSAILPGAIANLTNSERTQAHETVLTTNALLAKAASLKAEDMAAKGYFAHTSPEGKTPWYWFQQAGYRFRYAGENLAVNFVDSGDVVNAWMASTDHRANILNADFTEIGIGVARGTYEGRSALFVVQLFGTPLPAAVPAKETTVVALAPPSANAPATAPAASEVKGATTENVEKTAPPAEPAHEAPVAIPSFAEEILANPHTMNIFLYVTLATILLLGLFLTVFVKIRIQHPPLIAHAAVLLLVLGSFLVLNQYISLAHAKVF